MYIDLKIEYKYQDITGEFVDCFGYPEYTLKDIKEDIQIADWFWYTEGNGGCDCNRSTMTGLDKRFPEKCNKFGTWDCGHTIKFTKITPILTSIRKEEK